MLELQGTTDDFASLSLIDLLTALDLYHFHLINEAHVVRTAIGRYLMRRVGETGTRRPKRTFENSAVRDDSWQCVLVLVDRWVEGSRFGGPREGLHPYDMVPNALFLPDGRRHHRCHGGRRPRPSAALGLRLDRRHGKAIAESKLVAIEREALRALYEDPSFVPSLDLDHIGAVLV